MKTTENEWLDGQIPIELLNYRGFFSIPLCDAPPGVLNGSPRLGYGLMSVASRRCSGEWVSPG